jgi:hypothetical protein
VLCFKVVLEVRLFSLLQRKWLKLLNGVGKFELVDVPLDFCDLHMRYILGEVPTIPDQAPDTKYS